MTRGKQPGAIWRLIGDDALGTVLVGTGSGCIGKTRLDGESGMQLVCLSAGWINGVARGTARLLAVGSSRGELVLLDGLSLEVLATKTISEWINSVQFVDDHVLVAGTAEGNVQEWDFARDITRPFERCHADQIWDCRAVLGEGLLVTAGGAGEVVVWSTLDRRPMVLAAGPGYAVTCVGVLERSRSVVTVDLGGVLTVRHLDTLAPSRLIQAHESRIWSVAVSHDETRLATIGADRKAIIWDAEALSIIDVHYLDYSPTTCDFASGSGDLLVGDRNGGVHRVPATDAVPPEAIPSVGLTVFVMSLPPCMPGSLSQRVVEALGISNVAATIVDVSDDPLRCESLRRRSGFPFFPQVYMDGRFVAGGEVILEMAGSGFLSRITAKSRASA